MTISIICPKCGQQGNTPESAVGRIVECPKCGARWKVPGDGRASSVPIEDTGEQAANEYGQPARRRIPAGLLALLLTGGLFVVCGSGVGLLLYRDSQPTKGARTAAKSPPAIGPVSNAKRSSANNPRPKESGRAPESPDIEAAPVPLAPTPAASDFATIELRNVLQAYESNEAAADAQYLNKRVQFTFIPLGISKDITGYYAWDNIFGVAHPDKYGQHYKCYLRADQMDATTRIASGVPITLRSVCLGKTGMFNFYYAPQPGVSSSAPTGYWKSSPTVAFKDCEIIDSPPDRGGSHAPGKPAQLPPWNPPVVTSGGPAHPDSGPAERPKVTAESRQVISLGGPDGAYSGYLAKRVRFTCRPQRVHKADDGTYTASQSYAGRPHKFSFREDQGAVVADIEAGKVLVVRGVYAGKTGPTSAETFEDCELVQSSGGKPTEKPSSEQANKPDEKPVRLEQLIARETAQRTELNAAAQTGNDNVSGQLLKTQKAERDSWAGKRVEGKGTVVSVQGTEVTLYLPDGRRIRYVFAVAQDIDDPLLGKLVRGNLVEIKGIMDKRGRGPGDAFYVNGCTFTLKK
jgi:hypothetical protein